MVYSGAGEELLAFFEKYKKGLSGAVFFILGRNDEAEDILQEAFLKCLRYWKVKGKPYNLKGFVFTTTINTAKKFRDKYQKWKLMSRREGEKLEIKMDTKNPPEIVEKKEELELVRKAINRLNEKEKEVLILRISAGMTFEETAKALNIPVGTAKTRMRSALKNIREFISKGRNGNG